MSEPRESAARCFDIQFGRGKGPRNLGHLGQRRSGHTGDGDRAGAHLVRRLEAGERERGGTTRRDAHDRVASRHAALPQLRDRAGDRLGRHARAARIEDNGSARILLRAPYEASDDGPSVRAHLGVIR